MANSPTVNYELIDQGIENLKRIVKQTRLYQLLLIIWSPLEQES